MTGGGEEAKPFSLFYSYSHDDEDLCRQLQKHLSVLRRNGSISEWHDRNIDAGQEWAKEIDRNLCSADLILLLVSATFMASEYCWSVEIKKALERHDKGEARVIPVILRHCHWQSTPFAKLQAVPKDGMPVTAWTDLDAAFDDVVSKIERVVEELRRAERENARIAKLARQRRKKEEPRAEEYERDALHVDEQHQAPINKITACDEEHRSQNPQNPIAGTERETETKLPRPSYSNTTRCAKCGGRGFIGGMTKQGIGGTPYYEKCSLCGGTGRVR